MMEEDHTSALQSTMVGESDLHSNEKTQEMLAHKQVCSIDAHTQRNVCSMGSSLLFLSLQNCRWLNQCQFSNSCHEKKFIEAKILRVGDTSVHESYLLNLPEELSFSNQRLNNKDGTSIIGTVQQTLTKYSKLKQIS